jgi:hypothetical protein
VIRFPHRVANHSSATRNRALSAPGDVCRLRHYWGLLRADTFVAHGTARGTPRQARTRSHETNSQGSECHRCSSGRHAVGVCRHCSCRPDTASAGQAHPRPYCGRAAQRCGAGPDGGAYRSQSFRRCSGGRARRHASAEFLHHRAEELGHALDQSRPDGVCAAERLHRDGHRHGARRCRFPRSAERRHPLRGRRWPACLFAGQQQPLSTDGG